MGTKQVMQISAPSVVSDGRRLACLHVVADMAALRIESLPNSIGVPLPISEKPLVEGEEVTLCAYMRPFISSREAFEWLMCAKANELTPEQLKVKKQLRAKKQVRSEELERHVGDPWTGLLESFPHGKLISHGHVVSVGNGLVAVTNPSVVGASGGAYVRRHSPHQLVGIHLGRPQGAPHDRGNYNILLSVLHPGFGALVPKSRC